LPEDSGWLKYQFKKGMRCSDRGIERAPQKTQLNGWVVYTGRVDSKDTTRRARCTRWGQPGAVSALNS